MLIIYRILGFFINFVAALLAVSLVLSIPALLSSPLTMLSAFLIVAIILYTFNSYKFYRLVIQRNEIVNVGLRDWIRVNGIVALIFGIIIIIEIPVLIQNPQLYTEAINTYGGEMPKGSITGFFSVMLVYGLALTIHILMTFRLMKKHSEHFQ